MTDNFLRDLADDGLYLPPIKLHSLEKIRRHNYYASLFATGMKESWPQLAYVGLYSGAGRARVEPSGEIVETTAMSVMRLASPFTKYVFVDNDPRCIEALRQRVAAVPGTLDVSVLEGDVNEIVPLVRGALPRYSRTKGLLSFCFVDPFAADLRFDVIRALSSFRMDFLILLMLGWDARVNFLRYYRDHSSSRIAELIDCPTWRDEYERAGDRNVVRFLLGKFDEAMVRLGYLHPRPRHYHQVTAAGMGVLQYILVLYSKHALALKFWDGALRASSRQLDFGLE